MPRVKLENKKKIKNEKKELGNNTAKKSIRTIRTPLYKKIREPYLEFQKERDAHYITDIIRKYYLEKKLPVQKELLSKLISLHDKGLKVFETAESYNNWLNKPAFGLYNNIPIELLTTATGINEVMDELVRIEYGDLA